MRVRSHILLYALALLPLCVYAGTKVTDRHEIVFSEIPKPAHTWVYDFAATAADVPAESALAGQHSDHHAPQSTEQVEVGRKLGAEIASELVEQIRAMGLPADRRGGPDAPLADIEANPQVNVGTGTMTDRTRFQPVIECFIETLQTAEFPMGAMDVRENIKFKGGQFARWAHATFPDSACVLSIEFKKTFMDEWTGKPDTQIVSAIRNALASTVSPVLSALETTKK